MVQGFKGSKVWAPRGGNLCSDKVPTLSVLWM